MNFLDAAYEVLKKASRPLRYTEITYRAQSDGLLSTKGQTPEATMGARLYIDVKKPESRFAQVANGIFALKEPPPEEITQRIDEINYKTRSELQSRLMEMHPSRFEALIGELLLALGFKEETIQITKHTGDGGIDVRGVLSAGGITQINAAVQVKRWKNNIQAPVIQALRGSLTVHEQGIVVTTSKFSSGAIQEATAPGKMTISLIDGDRLLDLLFQTNIGVSSQQHTIFSIDKEWWGEDSKNKAEAALPPEPKLTVEYPLPIRGKSRHFVHQGYLLDSSGRTQIGDNIYESPSRAAIIATGWKTCNGWVFWRFQHPETGTWQSIDRIRPRG